VFLHACRTVAKRSDSRYRSGRCREWIKIKNPAHPAIERAMLIAPSGERRGVDGNVIHRTQEPPGGFCELTVTSITQGPDCSLLLSDGCLLSDRQQISGLSMTARAHFEQIRARLAVTLRQKRLRLFMS